MFKKAKRWIAFLLSLILVLQFQVPIVARAATVTKTVYGADCTYDSSTGILTVTGQFAGTQRAARHCADGYGPYSYFQGWFDGPIRKIVCKNLTLTTEYAAEGMFSKLQDLEEVVFENVNAHKATSMYLMFYNCPNLTSVDLSGLKTGTYDTMWVDTFERMFDDCRNLKYLNLGTTTTGLYIGENANVENMFRNCKPLRIEAPFLCQPIIPLSGTYSLPNGSQVEWLGAAAVRTTLKLVGAVDPDDPDPDDPDDPDNPINKPFVTISGTPKMGETLSAYVTNGQGMGSLSYQWKRNHSPISGATSSTYSIVGADIAKLLTCQVTGNDGTVIEAGAYALVEKMEVIFLEIHKI